jgi:hypothetical protein
MPTETTNEVRARFTGNNGRPTAEAAWLLIAAVTSAVALATWVDNASGLDPRLTVLLRVVACLAICGWFSRSAEARVRRQIDRAIGNFERGRREGFAAGYVAGVRRETPVEETVRLRSIPN